MAKPTAEGRYFRGVSINLGRRSKRDNIPITTTLKGGTDVKIEKKMLTVYDPNNLKPRIMTIPSGRSKVYFMQTYKPKKGKFTTRVVTDLDEYNLLRELEKLNGMNRFILDKSELELFSDAIVYTYDTYTCRSEHYIATFLEVQAEGEDGPYIDFLLYGFHYTPEANCKEFHQEILKLTKAFEKRYCNVFDEPA